jgi:hypothetical protein
MIDSSSFRKDAMDVPKELAPKASRAEIVFYGQAVTKDGASSLRVLEILPVP